MAEWTNIFDAADWDVYIAFGDDNYVLMDQLDPAKGVATVEQGVIIVNDLQTGYGSRPSVLVVPRNTVPSANYRLTVTTGPGFRFGQLVFFRGGTYSEGDFVEQSPPNQVDYRTSSELAQPSVLPLPSLASPALEFTNFLNPF
ncbi:MULTISPECIES: hypothetical protein [Xanthomonas]|uniref:Uncharacterized protein n=1 Tax=Xanthomonas dyei TaxID=743699 RepID=A0ABZ0D399_9XANT|nr:hypothetical protein [Xanthomonas dyei]WOB24750.1 hypothetical protein NYR99_13170 [Xanthomonas dyei]WOB52378.1 hypothetical protein NYR95_13175 [Xanthomonas dyei]